MGSAESVATNLTKPVVPAVVTGTSAETLTFGKGFDLFKSMFGENPAFDVAVKGLKNFVEKNGIINMTEGNTGFGDLKPQANLPELGGRNIKSPPSPIGAK